MRRLTEFRQLLLRFNVREHVRRAGRPIDRKTYHALWYQANGGEQRKMARERKQQRRRERWAKWLVEELRKA